MRKLILLSLLVAPAAFARGHFQETDLVSNQPGRAAFTDGNLVNAWGLAASPTGPWWVADNGAGLSTVYDGDGRPNALVVSVDDSPTGLVFNPESSFVVSNGYRSGPSVFLFATESGQILGWNPHLTLVGPTTFAVVAVNNGANAVYKGLALSRNCRGEQVLYATNFRSGHVEMYDERFRRIDDPRTFEARGLPTGYAPFGIAAIGDRIFVTWALQNSDKHDDVKGPGHGFVDEFDTDGNFIRRVASRGVLNSPWGLSRAPDDFGPFAGDLLVGNFGDGSIQVFHQGEWGRFHYAGALLDKTGNTLVVDGLWSIAFGNGAKAGPSDALFFTAGPDGESNGLLGRIDFVR